VRKAIIVLTLAALKGTRERTSGGGKRTNPMRLAFPPENRGKDKKTVLYPGTSPVGFMEKAGNIYAERELSSLLDDPDVEGNRFKSMRVFLRECVSSRHEGILERQRSRDWVEREKNRN